MPKWRVPVSVRRKKRRLAPGLVNYFKEKRELKSKEENGEEQPPSETSTCQTSSTEKVNSGSTAGECDVSGRRICNFTDLLEQLKTIEHHGPFSCTLKNFSVISEKRVGLKSQFGLKCGMCGFVARVWSELPNPTLMELNTCAVSGTMATGGGHAQLEEVLSVMNIPAMSDKTFRKYEEVVCKGWTATAQAEMKKAAEEEAALARERGDVDKDGVPLITVVADGSWCKRSYRTNYSSLSGVAAIVGHATRKVLYIGVKNKYCTSCARAESSGQVASEHSCYKNWGMNQSSTSMEAAIISEGFLCSEEMYGIRYARLIADGDSNVYKKILDSRPYKTTTVEKIECNNHLLRNLCNKLKTLATTSNRQKNTVLIRKKVGDSIMRCRMAVFKAAQHRREETKPTSEKINLLRQDILNIPSHVFGEHRCCQQRGYFCELNSLTAPTELNLIPALINANLYNQISEIFRDLSRHARSLLSAVTSNTVEHYNSVIAKFIGGKRINFALKGSYQSRCATAVVQHNSGRAHYNLHKEMYKTSPGIFTKQTENKRKRSAEKKKGKPRVKKSLFSTKTNSKDKDYGASAQRPDIDSNLMLKETSEFLKKLEKTEEEILKIERDTVFQSNSGQWLEIRRNLLTASNFGRVCKMKPSTSCESIVKQILYSRQIEGTISKKIESNGLFIMKEHPFLGATPDGLLNDDGIVEIKCPSSAKYMIPDEAIKNKKITLWIENKEGKGYKIDKNHNFYYQIQGQLQITARKYCLFALWTPKGLKLEKVEKDDEFWKSKVFPKLERFYKNCLLPELVDLRHCRSMPIKNPPYILEAQERLASAKIKKN